MFISKTTEELQKLVLEYFSRFSKYHIESLHCNPTGDWNIGGFNAISD